jgi:hypothetical protein
MKTFIAIGMTDDAAKIIEKHHYSKRMAANVQYCVTWHKEGGLFGDFGEAVAACVFSIPGTRWGEEVLELTRLVRIPEMPIQLTGLISKAIDKVKSAKVFDLVVSFADRTHGHHGGIYQAASWNYDSCRDVRMDGLIVDGQFIPGRSCNSRWGTRSPSKLREKFPGSVIEPHFDAGKHIYWKHLNRKGKEKAERLGLFVNPYPKPNFGNDRIHD